MISFYIIFNNKVSMLNVVQSGKPKFDHSNITRLQLDISLTLTMQQVLLITWQCPFLQTTIV